MGKGVPRVSIVTPSCNQAAFLEETLRSVLGQDYPNLEYIVVDGGSTDASVEIVRRYADRLAWWVSEPDGGQAAALNKGFARATGEILGWLNSDDTLLPGAVAAVVEALELDPGALLAYGDNVLVDESSRPVGLLPAREFDLATMLRTAQNHVVQPGSLFRRRALELAGPLDEAGYYYFDFEFVLRLGLHGTAVRVPRELATYRLHPGSKSMSEPVRKAIDHLRAFEAFFSRDLPPGLRRVEPEARSRACLVAGEYFYAGLEQRRARSSVLRGLRLHPQHISLATLSFLAKTFLPGRLVARLRRLRAR